MGRIFGLKRFEIHDGDGIRTTLFLKGCPLKCMWCHNPEGIGHESMLAVYPNACEKCGACRSACPSGAHVIENGVHTFLREKCLYCGACESACANDAVRLYGKEVTAREILPKLLEDRMFYGETGGVTLSGGEPLLQADFCFEILCLLKKEGIHTAVDTCGLVQWSAFEKILAYTDLFLFDVKCASSELHEKLTGAKNDLILANLRKLDACGKRIEVRIPLIPGMNDSEMPEIGGLLSSLKSLSRVKVLGYHNLAKDKYEALGLAYPMKEQGPAEKAQVEEVVSLFRNMNLPAE